MNKSDEQKMNSSVSTAEVNWDENTECDACRQIKPDSAFERPGHLPGGTDAWGFDIDSAVCAECAERRNRVDDEERAQAAYDECAE